MIEKILKIENLWRFQSFSGSNDDLKFDKNTFIFWKNTHWKSTFSAIFNSIYKDNPDYIIWRRTFKSSSSQEIKIKTDNDVIQFNSNKWDKSLKIKVFDSHYISENIYNNDYLDDDKQWKIASIILWKEWKQKEKYYIDAKTNCDKNSNRRREITNIYNTNFVKNTLSFDDFRKIDWTKIDVLETEKEEKSKTLNSYTNQETIKKILLEINNSLKSVNLIDVSLIKDKLEINWWIIRKHIEDNIKISKEATNFLANWVKLLNWDNCSFCWQKLDTNALNLIDELNKLFSDSYKTLNSNFKKINLEFSNISIVNNLLKYKIQLSKHWIDIEIDNFIADIEKEILNFKQELTNKGGNLNYEINFDSFNNLKTLSETFYNDKILVLETKYNSKIEESKINKIKDDIKLIEIKLNYNKKFWSDLCVEYSSLEKDYNEVLKPLDKKTFDEKNEYAKKVLQDYEEWINDILDKLNASFKLTNFSVPEKRRWQINLFSLQFLDNDEDIPLNWDDNQLNQKNTLSESDKRLLAFAFFITDIKKIQDLDEYIIVLDDPMSSLDSERKYATINLIRDWIINKDGKWYNQAIILTHEENFFKFLDEQFREDKKLLRINYIPRDKNSKIIPCDIEEEFFKEEHFKKLETYNKNLEDNDFTNCDLKDVRIILEHIIDRKYYIRIDKEKRKKWWIIKWYYDDNNWKNDIQTNIIDIFPNISHHDLPRIKEWNLSDWDKRTIIKKLFELIEKI